MPNYLYVVGSFNIDHCLNLDTLPQKGQTLSARHYSLQAGGKGANQALAAGRFAPKCTYFVTSVGKDSFTNAQLTFLKNEGIDVSLCQFQNHSSGLAVVMVDEAGDNQIVIYPGANAQLDSKPILKKLQPGDWVLLQMEIPLKTVEKIAHTAFKIRAKVILNPAPAVKLSSYLYNCLEYITPNETETRLLTGIDPVDEKSTQAASDFFRTKGVKHVCMTLGNRGYFLSDNGYIVPGIKTAAVDTTAAGDTFNGVFAAKLLKNQNPKEACILANKASAFCVGKMGAMASIPKPEDLT